MLSCPAGADQRGWNEESRCLWRSGALWTKRGRGAPSIRGSEKSSTRNAVGGIMDYSSVAADPFSILTIVVAPAVLTNASSVLALGTNNRLARVADRTHALTARLANLESSAREHEVSASELAALQTRAQLLLRALRYFYLG